MLVGGGSREVGAWHAAAGPVLRALRKEERGAAILTVITLITVGLAVGGVAIMTATNAMRGSLRDEGSKDALAAAEAGAQIALQRQNQVEVTDEFPCVSTSAGALVAGPEDGNGWCPGFEGTAGDAGYDYTVSRPVETARVSRIEVVATGEANGVTRRIHVRAESPTATAVFTTFKVIGDDGITLDGNATILGNAGTNGDIELLNRSRVCGAAQYGETGQLTPADYTGADCPPGYSFESGQGSLPLPPIDQGTAAETNNNGNIDPSSATAVDAVSGNRGDVVWDPVNRTLVIGSNSALTLSGERYSFCMLHLHSNSQLIIHHETDVQIFFDAPENCPTLGAGPQILLDSNSKIAVTDGSPDSLQIFLVGSDDPGVTSDNVVLNSNSRSEMPLILYAPSSALELDSNARIFGAVGAQAVHMDSNASITSHESASDLELPLPLLYRQTQFVECISAPPPDGAPSSSC